MVDNENILGRGSYGDYRLVDPEYERVRTAKTQVDRKIRHRIIGLGLRYQAVATALGQAGTPTEVAITNVQTETQGRLRKKQVETDRTPVGQAWLLLQKPGYTTGDEIEMTHESRTPGTLIRGQTYPPKGWGLLTDGRVAEYTGEAPNGEIRNGRMFVVPFGSGELSIGVERGLHAPTIDNYDEYRSALLETCDIEPPHSPALRGEITPRHIEQTTAVIGWENLLNQLVERVPGLSAPY